MIIGPRQVDKTTLILRYLEGIDHKGELPELCNNLGIRPSKHYDTTMPNCSAISIWVFLSNWWFCKIFS